MLLFSNFKNSIYGPAFYLSLFKKKLSFSFKYFFGFITVFSLLIAVNFVFFRMPPPTTARITPYLDKFELLYPKDLIITIKNGEASTNSKTPTFIDLPKNIFPNETPAKSPAHLLVIDTAQPSSVELFQKYDTAALLAKDAFMTIGQHGFSEIRTYPLGKAPDASLDKTLVTKLFNILKSFLPYVLPLFFLLMFCVFLSAKSFYLFYLLVAALPIWLLAKMMRVKASYGKAYQIGLHAITLAMILDETLFVIRPTLKFPFAFTVITLIVVFVNLRIKKANVAQT